MNMSDSAEDTATGMLGNAGLKKVKDADPDRMIVVMGCMVGPSDVDLRRRFPQVDLWARPQDFTPILETVAMRHGIENGDLDGCLANLVPNDPKVATFRADNARLRQVLHFLHHPLPSRSGDEQAVG